MRNRYEVRIEKTTLHDFKNVNYGELRYMNYSSIEKKGFLETSDIVGIYGQNGSGKTALIEALDVLKYIITGNEVPYKTFSGLISECNPACLEITLFIVKDDKKYKVQYSVTLCPNSNTERIELREERLIYWTFGNSWNSKRDISFVNPCYQNMNVLVPTNLQITSDHISAYKNIPFLNSMQLLATVCAENHTSVFFNDKVIKSLSELLENAGLAQDQEIVTLYHITKGIFLFGTVDLHVIKVNQLCDINSCNMIPLNLHQESEGTIIQGCIPLFTEGTGELPEEVFELFTTTIKAINIALTAIIPNLQISYEIKNTFDKPDGKRYIQLEVYSIRDGKKFLTKYESEGIKRIISLLNYLISVFNETSVCLVVDELDSGIFEYLLGEILGVMQLEMKGQLIFTSHNLRILEKLDYHHIICSTTNSNNRYIRLTGISTNNNKRDFYLRSLLVGGQKECLYDEADLQSIEHAFRKAGKASTKELDVF